MKYKIIAAIVALAAAYYAGVKSASKPEVKSEVAKTIDKDSHTETITITKKDGTTKTVTKNDTSVRSQSLAKTESKPADAKKVHVQLMYGFDLTRVAQDRNTYYGISISKTLIGPVTGGAFILINGRTTPVGGLTLGVEL